MEYVNRENEELQSEESFITTKDLVITSLLIAIVFVATMFINIRLPFASNGGLVHLGNVPLFVAAILFGPRKGALAGAIGMGLFDLASGWALWAPFTFVVRGVMGYIIGSVANLHERQGNSIIWNIMAILLGSIWMLIGYYFTEVILYGNWISPVGSVPGNITQLVVGAIIGLPLAKALYRLRQNII